jgi:hypothetical protein
MKRGFLLSQTDNSVLKERRSNAPQIPQDPSPFALMIENYAKNTIMGWFSAMYRFGSSQAFANSSVEELVLSGASRAAILDGAQKYFNDTNDALYGKRVDPYVTKCFDEMQKAYGPPLPCMFLNLLVETVVRIFDLVFRSAVEKLLPWNDTRNRENFLDKIGRLYEDLHPLKTFVSPLEILLRSCQGCSVSGLACGEYRQNPFKFVLKPE